MTDLRISKIAAAERLMSQLNELNDLLLSYIYEIKADGSDSQAADDYLDVFQNAEMCIQSFTNRISDISEAEQDDAQSFDDWNMERLQAALEAEILA